MSMSFTRPPVSERVLARINTLVQQKYRVTRLLGVGGTAAVYAATHRNGHQVAIKFLLEHLLHDPDMYQLFRREAYVANRVEHPGTVPVLDDDIDEAGSAFLIMPLLEGETLRARWERAHKRVPASEAAVLITDALDVLASAHAKGIVHRDIKPENLFVTRAGEVRVMDFGIARRGDTNAASATFTLTGRIVGTPAFMPPEQALGDKTNLGPHSDCWAVGATLFTLLSGEHVHVATSSGAQLVAAATKPARPLASVLPDVPPAIARVVDQALSFEPADRWRSAQEMREALLAALEEATGEKAAITMNRVREKIAAEFSTPAEDLHGSATLAPKLTRPGEPMDSRVRRGDWRIFRCRDGTALAQFGNLGISIWMEGATGVSFEEEREVMARLARDRPEGFGWLCIMAPNANLSEETLRRCAAELESHADRIRASAAVVAGEGMAADLTRSMLSGMAVILARRLPSGSFSTIPAALDWMAQQMNVGSTPAVATFIEELTHRLQTQGADVGLTDLEISSSSSSSVRRAGGRILYRRDGFATALRQRLYLSLWQRGFLDDSTDPHAGMAESIRNEPDGIALLCVLGPTTRPAELSFRRASASIAWHRDVLRCAACVIEGDVLAGGMKQDTYERHMADLKVFLSEHMPFELFSNVADALPWMAKFVHLGDVPEMARFVESVRDELR